MKCDTCAGRVHRWAEKMPEPAEGTKCEVCHAVYKTYTMRMGSDELGYGESVDIGLWFKPDAIARLREAIDA